MNELSLMDKAEDLAQYYHLGQKRRFSGTPYITHPFRVMNLVKQLGMKKEEQLIALLHDIYENNTNKNKVIEDIKNKFGQSVANAVIVLSHDSDINYNEYLLKIAKSNPKIFTIKLIDMYTNILDNPSTKQINKYKSAIEFIIEKGIEIPLSIKNLLFKSLKINI